MKKIIHHPLGDEGLTIGISKAADQCFDLFSRWSTISGDSTPKVNPNAQHHLTLVLNPAEL